MPDRKTHAFRRLTIYAGEASVVVPTDFMKEAADKLTFILADKGLNPTGCLSRFAKKMLNSVGTANNLSAKRSQIDKSKSQRELNNLPSYVTRSGC